MAAPIIGGIAVILILIFGLIIPSAFVCEFPEVFGDLADLGCWYRDLIVGIFS